MTNLPTTRTGKSSEKEGRFLAATVLSTLMDLFALSSIQQIPKRFVRFTVLLKGLFKLNPFQATHEIPHLQVLLI
jgi:hypothetical protein